MCRREFATLIQLLDSTPKSCGTHVENDILCSVSSILSRDVSFKDTFRKVGGFSTLATVLATMHTSTTCVFYNGIAPHICAEEDFAQGMEEDLSSLQPKLSMLESLFQTYTIALCHHKENKRFFRDNQGAILITG